MELVIYNIYLCVSTGVHQANNESLNALGHCHDIDRDKISIHAQDIIFHVICFLRGPIAQNSAKGLAMHVTLSHRLFHFVFMFLRNLLVIISCTSYTCSF